MCSPLSVTPGKRGVWEGRAPGVGPRDQKLLCFPKEMWDTLAFQPLAQAAPSHIAPRHPAPGPPYPAWAEMGIGQKARALPRRSQYSSPLGAPSSAGRCQGLGTREAVGTGRFLGTASASQRPSCAQATPGLWRVSDRLCQDGCHSRASSHWFSKPRGIRAKPGDPESLRVTVPGSWLLPIPHFPTLAAFLSPAHLLPGSWVQSHLPANTPTS